MQIKQHADRSEALTGLRAEDIHQWIDGFFDTESFQDIQRTGVPLGFDPYNHRKYRHCVEALEDAVKIFEGRYTRAQIQAVFESHIKDDYDGYVPHQEDFENGTFTEKYHETRNGKLHEAILSEAELTEYFKGKTYPPPRAQRLSSAFYWRIVWPTVFAAVLFAASSFTIIVPLVRQNMMEQKKVLIRELTQTAASAIAFYVHQEQDGQMTRAIAQAKAAAELSQLRYGDDGKDYFWITDMHPVMVMHPYRPDLVGKDLTDYTDSEDKSGKKLFVNFVQLVQHNSEGYLEYRWQWKDDPTRTAPKLSYVRGIPEWGWIIGTGIYIQDIETEMQHLSEKLLIADSLIAFALFILLGNLIFQSRRIEQNRTQAESGLREAKDRYRALVEASSEGSILEVDGKTVYANQAMRRMTGYSEKELTDMDIRDLLALGHEPNTLAANHLHKLYTGEASAAEFEAVLQTKTGQTLNVWISTSRLFFSHKHGHVILFDQLARGREETLRGFHNVTVPAAADQPLNEIQNKIDQSCTAGEVVHILKELPERIRGLTDRGTHADILRKIIGESFDAAIRRFIALSLKTMPTPAVPFAFLSLGSHARHDMTLFSDQDNALIFADVPAEQLSVIRRNFLRIGEEVCGRLKQAGCPYCPGGIMAANPKWCLSLSEWKNHFKTWIQQATPQSILEVNVFLDIRCAYGDDTLVRDLKSYVQALTQNSPEFFMHYANNSLQYKAPLTLFGHLKTQKQAGKKTINIKESLKPIETFARIYALNNNLPEVGTLERIRTLQELEILQPQTGAEMGYIFNYLWQLRLYTPLISADGMPSVNDQVDIEAMTEIERQNLQNVLAKISTFQTKLSYDFLGTAGH
ncbi:MAG: cache domain-containing protein [Verrucomicrobia bacterium]|nr:cache domain-containing protein [Verrucomicrobiota bacterium]